MSVLLYAESPLNPLRIMRHRPDAGLAFEKHRWLFPSKAIPETLVSLFTFGFQPLQEIYVNDEIYYRDSDEAIPQAQYLAADAIPTPPLHFTLVFDTEKKVPEIVETLVNNWQTPIYLVFSQALIKPFNAPPRNVKALIAEILGHEWDGDADPGWVPLLDAKIRQRALQALGTKEYHRLYLVAGLPSPTILSTQIHTLFKNRRGLTKEDEPEVDYQLFHGMLSRCDWILTSHGNVPGVTPFCFYSVQDLRFVFQERSPTVGEMRSQINSQPLVEFDDINALNQAAGIILKPRGGLSLSEIVPLEMLVEATELSLAWSNLDRLDELPTLNKLRHLNLDGTQIDQLGVLSQMTQLESLSLRYLQLADLQPLTTLPSLQQIALSRIPDSGLSSIAAMPALVTLNLDLLPIDNASFLRGCQGLKNLSLNHTPLKELDEIAKLSSLEKLSICSTAVSNIKPLTALPNLRELLMDGCKMEDLTPLAEIAGLTTFSLTTVDAPHLQIPDLSPLATMQGLRSLYLYGTTFKELPSGSLTSTLEALDISDSLTNDLQWITNFTALRHLNVSHSKAPDFSLLRAVTNLEILNLSGCKVGDLAWLNNLVKLLVLNLNWADINDLQPLINLSNLRSLSLAGTYVDKSGDPLDILSTATEIKELNVSGWKIGNSIWLPNLKQLQVLNLSNTDFEDTALLRDISHLTELDLSQTQISSLDGLVNMQNLRCLNLNNTLIDDLSPIYLATQLEELSLRGTAITDLKVLSDLKNLKKLDLRDISNRDCDFSPLLELPRLILLRLDSHGILDNIFVALKQRHRVVIRPT